jgi:hypothetical protein
MFTLKKTVKGTLVPSVVVVIFIASTLSLSQVIVLFIRIQPSLRFESCSANVTKPRHSKIMLSILDLICMEMIFIVVLTIHLFLSILK